MSVIIGNNERIYIALGDNHRIPKWLNASTQSAARGAQLTGQLLSLARQLPLDTKPLNLNDLVNGNDRHVAPNAWQDNELGHRSGRRPGQGHG